MSDEMPFVKNPTLLQRYNQALNLRGAYMGLLPSEHDLRMLVIDIDGTLTDENKLLHTGAVEALRKLEQAGIPVGLATGNVRPITWGLWRFLGITGPMICETGGVIWEPQHEQLLHMADGARSRAAAEWLSTQIDGLDASGIESNAWRESEWCLKVQEDDERIRELLSNSEWPDLKVVRTGFAIHLAEPQVNKGNGLLKSLEIRGISPQQVCVVGDAPNDDPLFEVAGWSIAVGGAFESTAELADVKSPYFRADTFPHLVNEWLA